MKHDNEWASTNTLKETEFWAGFWCATAFWIAAACTVFLVWYKQ